MQRREEEEVYDDVYTSWFNEEIYKNLYKTQYVEEGVDEAAGELRVIDEADRGYCFNEGADWFDADLGGRFFSSTRADDRPRFKRKRPKRSVNRHFLLRFVDFELNSIEFTFQEWCFLDSVAALPGVSNFYNPVQFKSVSAALLKNFLYRVSASWIKQFAFPLIGFFPFCRIDGFHLNSRLAYSFFSLGFITRVLKINIVLCSGLLLPHFTRRLYPFEAKLVVSTSPEPRSFFYRVGYVANFHLTLFERSDFYIIRGVVFKDFLEFPTYRPVWAVALADSGVFKLFSYLQKNVDILVDVFKILPYKSFPAYLLTRDAVIFNIFRPSSLALAFGFVEVKCFSTASVVVVVSGKKKFVMCFVCEKFNRFVFLVYVPYSILLLKFGSIVVKMHSLIFWKNIQHLFKVKTCFYANFILIAKTTFGFWDEFGRRPSWYHKSLSRMHGYRGLRKFFNNRKLFFN